MITPKKSWLLASGLIAAIVILLVMIIPFSEILELKSVDIRMRAAGGNPVTAPIVIVAIDDASFEDINIRWPWPREILAAAILKLKASGAKILALDIMLGDKGYSPIEDIALAAAIKVADNVIMPTKFDQKVTGDYKMDTFDAPLEIFGKNTKSTGFINLPLDTDGLVRRVYTYDQTLGKRENAFGISILDAYTKASLETYNAIGLNNQSLIIHYSQPGAFTTIPFYKIIRGEFEKSAFKDKIVIIGAFFKESHDQLLTPFETTSGLYGIEIHANIINTLYGNNFLTRSSPLATFFILLIATLVTAFLFTRIKPIRGFISLLACITIWISLGFWLFTSHAYIINLTNVILALSFNWIGAVTFQYVVVDKEKRKVRSTFSRYVAPEIVNTILKDNTEINLGGETKEVVIFFSDICGFTSLSEQLSPQEVVEMLNEIFTELTEIIFRHEGTFNKYIGDAIMAFFGAPLAVDKASEKAFYACMEIRSKLADLNSHRILEGKLPVQMGMGLHKGEVLVGNIGSPRQMEYTIIGDAVNVCSRIEGLTRALNTDFLISDEIYQDVKDIVDVETHKGMILKGKKEAITVHSILGIKNHG